MLSRAFIVILVVLGASVTAVHVGESHHMHPALIPPHTQRVNGSLPPCQATPSNATSVPLQWQTSINDPYLGHDQNLGDVTFCCGGMVVLGGAHSYYGLNGTTGSIVWNNTYTPKAQPRMKSPPIWNDEIIYYTIATGHVVGVDARTGHTVWKFRGAPSGWLSRPRVSTIANGGKGLVFFTSASQMYGVDAAKGHLVWNQSVPCHGSCATMSVTRDQKQILQTADNIIFSLDVDTGKTLWSVPLPTTSTHQRGAAGDDCPYIDHSTGRVDDSLFVVYLPGDFGAWVCAFNRSDSGRMVWNFTIPIANSHNMNNVPFVTPSAYGKVYVNFRSWLYAVRCDSGAQQWNWSIPGPGHRDDGLTTPFATNGKIVFGADDNALYVLESGSGEQLVRQPLSGDPWSDPVALPGGQAFIGAENGMVFSYCAAPDNGRGRRDAKRELLE